MNVHTLPFLVFTALILALYYLLPRRYQHPLLLAASYLFYSTFAWWFAAALALVTAVTYGCGQGIAARGRPRLWLAVGLAVNLAGLVSFKAAAFLHIETTDAVSRFGLPTEINSLRILLPIGLSFYVLQAISYLLDLYRRQLDGPGSWMELALYLSYFPKLTAGPIEKTTDFFPALRATRIVDNTLVSKGVCLVLIGLLRKVVVADTLLLAIPPAVFQSPEEFSSWALLYWLVIFAFGLYNDFCGYTNIVRGVSSLFGIDLTRNFNNPFMFRNIADLWTRWHVSLSTWLRDYIFFPLSRALLKRRPSPRNLLNVSLPLLVTMVASGFWHGSQLNFLVWGVWMGLLMTAERLVALYRPVKPAHQRSRLARVAAFVYFRIVVFAGLIVFVLDLTTAGRYFAALANNTAGAMPDMRIALALLPGLFIDVAQATGRRETVFLDWPLGIRVLLTALALAAVLVFAQSRPGTAFIYQGF